LAFDCARTIELVHIGRCYKDLFCAIPYLGLNLSSL
jgi:hypothetical protein